MAFLVSPGVQVNEIDLSNFIPALSTSIGGYAGYFNWGPGDETVLVTDEGELGRIFGVPNLDGDLTESSFFTAASFLKYSNALQIARAIPADSYNANSSGSDSPEFRDGISTADQLDQYGNADTIYGRYPGSKANGIEVWFIDKKQWDSGDGDGKSLPTEIRSSLSHIPSITDWANDIVGGVSPAIYDEVHVVVIDALGKFTGQIGAILEIFPGLSYASNAKTSQYNESNYYVKVVNDRSRYIWLGPISDSNLIDSETTSVTLPYTNETTQKFTLSNGTNGDLTDESEIVKALGLFEDAGRIDVNLLFAQNFLEDTQTLYQDTQQFNIDQEIIRIADERRDLVGFISAPIGVKNISTSDDKLDAVLNKFAFVASNNYIVFDSGPAYVYNRYRDGYTWIPLCGHIAGLCAYTDDVADPWFSPAGLNRGQLNGIVKLGFNPNQVQRDELYKNRINPVISYPGQGIVLYGDKTGQSKPSAFDRINVRRLFITIEKAIANASKFQLFELNDEFTRSTFVNAIVPYLRDVQGRRGIVDFRVVCDETNNTPEVIDTNRFIADIYIKPTRSINFIYLNFVATRTAASFEEIIGR